MTFGIPTIFRSSVVLISFFASCINVVSAEADTSQSIGKAPDLGLYWDDWSAYIQTPPNIIRTSSLPAFYATLLQEQEDLVNQVIELSLASTHPNINKRFENEIAMLALDIPGSTQASTSVTRRYRHSNTYANDTGIVRGPTYTTYRTEEITRQTDPEIIKEFTSLVNNVKADELETFIERFRFRLQSWKRKLASTSDSGSAGATKTASLAYLDEVQEYLMEWVALKSKIDEYQKTFGNLVEQRQAILSSWKSFEEKKLPHLNKYMSEQKKIQRDEINPNFFYLDKGLSIGEELIAEVMIGGRLLFFRIHPRTISHPGLNLYIYE